MPVLRPARVLGTSLALALAVPALAQALPGFQALDDPRGDVAPQANPWSDVVHVTASLYTRPKLPTNLSFGVRLAEPVASSTRPPMVEVDRNGDGKADRRISGAVLPRGKAAVYTISKGKPTKRIGKAQIRKLNSREYDLTAAASLLAAKGKVRWRVVTLTAKGGRADVAPDEGFQTFKTTS